MPHSSSAPISVGFISLGCAKNLVDSQLMAGTLLSEDIVMAASPEEADIVIVNSCAFIEDAREESIEHILAACEMKKTGPCRAVIVAGCLPQRYQETVQNSLPDVDAFMGLDQLDEIGQIVKRLAGGEQQIVELSQSSHRVYNPVVPGVVFTGGPFAYLKIAEGCDHQCAFCAIPAIRGKHRSRSIDDLVAEARGLLANGFCELNLISQDTTSYGRDLGDDVDLCKLLRALGDIGGDFWIRLLYGYPTRVGDRLLQTMQEVPQLCHYLDIPIQHSHPAILKAMSRADTVEPVRQLAAKARKALPDIALRTTCLLGFPGETEESFQHLLSFVQETEFDHLGSFVFSPEENTTAYDMEDLPDLEEAEERRERLMLAQREIVARKAAERMGTEQEVLLERKDEETGLFIGRSRRQAPEVDGETIITDTPANAAPGQFVRVKYTEQLEYDLKSRYIAPADRDNTQQTR